MGAGEVSIALTYGDIAEGDSASFSVVITDSLVNAFAELSGDHNPLHMDSAYAETTFYKEKIAREQLQMARAGDQIYYVS